ncbi:hypothetical protein Hanom_Chr02g00126611 [Helianthus anomalus]
MVIRTSLSFCVLEIKQFFSNQVQKILRIQKMIQIQKMLRKDATSSKRCSRSG